MKHLRSYIRQTILEGLRMGEDLMILNHPKDKNKVFILVDGDYMDDFEVGQDIDFWSMGRDYVKGMIQLSDRTDNPCDGALSVKRAAAEDGYGPTLYDIVMEITKQPLINDRDSVSREAKSMMDFYLKSRPDVDKNMLDNIEDLKTYPRTPDTSDDCGPGDMATYLDGIIQSGGWGRDAIGKLKWEDDPTSYSYNKPTSGRAMEMLDKGNKCIAKHNMDYRDIRKLASQFFKTRY